jgi:hypothetical protein
MINVIMLTIDANKTLTESWEKLAGELLKQGASQSQVDVMQSAFFLGAVHIYARLDTKVSDSDTFYNTMDELMDELSCARVEDLPVMGHA